MKRSPIVAVLVSLAVLCALMGGTWLATYPQTALAQDGVEPSETYAVTDSAGLEEALEKIEDLDEGSVARISVSGTIVLSDVGQLAGVEGRTVQYVGDGSAYLSVADGDAVIFLAGDTTFENVHVSPATIYANGHALVLGDGFGGGMDGETRMTVYGGADGDLNLAGGSTSVTVLDGVYKLIAGGNSAGTLTGDTYVEFGGSAKFPTAADGAEEGDRKVAEKSSNYNLQIDAKGEAKWNGSVLGGTAYQYGILPYGIYGGGTCGNTVGDTHVEMTGGEVYQIFGGGAARRNPTYASDQGITGELDDLGRVSGDTNVLVTGGTVKSIYGGGYNDIYIYGGYEYKSSGVPDDARTTRAVVSGTAHVTIEGDAVVPACEQSEDASTSGADPAAVHGGSFHSTVGATEVVVGGNARIESGGKKSTGYGYGTLFGAGTNDIVLNTTSVMLTGNARIGVESQPDLSGQYVVSQGYFSSMTPLGYAAKSGCYLGGAKFSYGSEILNQGGADYAATATVEGGQVDVLTIGNKSRNGSQAFKSVAGNVLLQQTGGAVSAIEASCISEKKVKVTGNVDVKVSGGTVENYIMGKYDSGHVDDGVIEGKATLVLSGAAADGGYLTVPLIETMDSVTVKKGAKIAVEGDWTVNDYEGKYGVTNPKPNYMNPVTGIPFYQVKELTVEEGAALAISQEHALIEGSITINGQLENRRSNSGVEAPLTAEGTASGTGSLLPFEGANYGTGLLPKEGEEYVYAQKAGSDMELTLANAGTSGLYVDVRDEKNADDRSAWYIAKADPFTVAYEFGDDAPDYVTAPAAQEDCYPGGTVTVADEPTAPGWEFKGWESDDVKIGSDGTFTMPNGDVTITGTWERTATPLTPTATSLVAYEGGDGSSANPDDALPEPVWRFESEGWTLYFDGVEQSEGATAFNWAYFSADENAEQTDAATKGVYELRAWPLNDVSEVMAKDKDGAYYYLDLDSEQVVEDDKGEPVTVRVRDVTDDEAAESLAAEVFKPVYGADTAHVAARSAIQDGTCDVSEAHAHVADGTTFETNGIDGLAVSNDASISLLFDEFIPDVLGQSDRMDVLDGKARSAAGGVFATSENVQTEFRYMDLVDTSNGNAWVAPADESAVTVFLPYTDSMTAESEIAVAYFDDLTRDYTVDLGAADLDEEVADTTAHALAVTKTEDGITFEVPYREFGPFEIMWASDEETEEPGEGEEGETPEQPGDDEKPERPAGDKGAETDKGAAAMPATGDASFSAAPALLAGCSAVAAAALCLRRKAG